MRRVRRHAWIWLTMLGVLTVAVGPAHAATVASVQRGDAVSSGGTLTVTLADPVDPAASVLFFSTRHGSAAPRDVGVRGRLASTSSLEFVRPAGAAADVGISWYLVEFASGVKVQRGQVAQSGNTLDVTLAEPVASRAQAFVLYSKTSAAADFDWGSDDPIGGYLRNTTTLRFRTDASSGHVIDYQVVEFTDPGDVLVQSGEANFNSNQTSMDVHLSQDVDPSATFVLAGHTVDGSSSDIGTRLLQAEVVDDDEIRFSRGATGNQIGRVVWQAIELRDGSRVLHGTELLGYFDTVRTVSLPEPVDRQRAIAFSGMQSYGGQSLGAAGASLVDTWLGNVPGRASFTFDLTDDDTLSIERSMWGTAGVGWFVLEFNAPPPAPVPVLDVPMNELAWSGSAGEVSDEASGHDGTGHGGATTRSADPAIAGSPGTCRYGDFDGNDDYLSFPDAAHLDIDGALTVAIWINARTLPPSQIRSIVSKDTNYEFHLDAAGRIYWWWNDASGTVRSLTSSASVGVDTWHHVAITYTSGSQVIYLDGAPVGTASYSGTLRSNDVELQVGQDQDIAERFWDGRLDELKIYREALDPGEVQAVMNQTQPCLAQPLGDWRFDEAGWNGSAGEVVDYSGNDHHGTAFGTATDTGLVCRAADLGANGTSDYLTLDAAAFDGLGDFTLSAWYRGGQSSAMSIVSGANAAELNELIFFFWAPDRFDPHLKGGEAGDITPPLAIDDGNWHFLAWTRNGVESCLYVDDVLAGCGNRPAGALDVDALVVGQEQDALGGGFDPDQDVEGDLDELLLFDRVLSAGDLAAIRANHLTGLNWDGSPRDCPAPGIAGFEISHDGAGIHCTAESVTVTAVDASGAVVAGYAGQITLDTGTGRGDWSVLSGTGTLSDATAGDGNARYLFGAADNGTVTFALSYPEGAAVVDVDVHQSDDVTLHDDDTEGVLTFAPTGLTLTAHALPNPPPRPIADPLTAQTAGSHFPLHITAFGVTEDDPQCGVIESYDGTRSLTFTMDHVNPGTGTRLAAVNGNAVDSGIAQPVTFAAGQAEVAVRYKDVGAIRLSVQDAVSFPDVLIGGTNSFVVKPARLAISRIASSGGIVNPGASTATGTGFLAAGTAFEVDVDALDVEGELTPNYGLESPAERVAVSLAAIMVPTAGGVGTLSGGAAFVPSGVPGRHTGASVAFDEVGVIRLRPDVADGDYLGAGPVTGTVSGPVGRFHPASFELVSASFTPACGSFTYMGQPAASLQYRLRALNAAGDVTVNYDVASLGAGAVASLAYAAEAADAGVDMGARLSNIGGTWVAGEVNVLRHDVAFARLAAPDGAFDPLQLSLMVTDPLDGIALSDLDSNPTTSGNCVLAGNCSARALGAGHRVVYGRLAVLPAAGPENEDLAVPLAAQMFTGSAFEQNPADNCSAYLAAGLGFGAYSGNLSAGETSAIGPAAGALLLGGHADPANPLLLAAPGFGNDGSADVILDVPAWLEYDWLGAGATDPTATASFGRLRGHDRIIYWGEAR